MRKTHANTNKPHVNIQVNKIVACCSKGWEESRQGAEVLNKAVVGTQDLP